MLCGDGPRGWNRELRAANDTSSFTASVTWVCDVGIEDAWLSVIRAASANQSVTDNACTAFFLFLFYKLSVIIL